MQDIILNRANKYCSRAYNWCCNSMKYSVTYEDKPEPGCIVLYRHVWREFSIPSGDITSGETAHAVDYCPFCGSRLPRSLWDEWLTCLEDEYHLIKGEELLKDFLTRVPPEFRSDEWWKKRGL